MATGELAQRTNENGGVLVRVETGVLVSTRPTCGPVAETTVFSSRQLQTLDDIIADAEQSSGLRFAAYLGDLGADTRVAAENILTGFEDDAPYTVLVAVSPQQRVIEIVTGLEAALRITDRAARVAVLAVSASARDGDLNGALVNGIRVLSDHAGSAPETF